MIEQHWQHGDAQWPITPGPLITVCTENSSGAEVVHVAGDIDLCTAPALRTWLTAQLGSSTQGSVLVVDLAAVGFMSVAGLHVLLGARCRAAARGTDSGWPAAPVSFCDSWNRPASTPGFRPIPPFERPFERHCPRPGTRTRSGRSAEGVEALAERPAGQLPGG